MTADASSRIGSALDLVERQGVGRLFRSAMSRIRSGAFLREQHIWHVLATEDRPTAAIPQDAAIELVGVDRLDEYLRLPTTVTAREADRRLADGAELWLTTVGTVPAFGCWVFREASPVEAAASGWLSLVPTMAVLEDSVASPDHRGRGLAPTTWAVIADHLREAGVEFVLTKVELANLSSHKAVAKVGFEPTALMTHARIFGRRRVTVEPFGRYAGSDVANLLRTCAP